MRQENKPGEPNFRIGNIVTVNVTRDKGYRHSYKNGRTANGFIYVLRGLLIEQFSDTDGTKEIMLEPGEVLFVPQGARYIGIYGKDNTELKVVQFDLLSGELAPYLTSPLKIELGNAAKHIERFFTSENKEEIRHPFYYLSTMYELLWRIDEHYTGASIKYKRLRPALTELAVGYREKLPVSHYAALCGMSEVSFRRNFREQFGCSPIDYRNELRLEKARELITSGEYNVTEAAMHSGFSNLSFFIKLYKKKYGHTPKKE